MCYTCINWHVGLLARIGLVISLSARCDTTFDGMLRSKICRYTKYAIEMSESDMNIK